MNKIIEIIISPQGDVRVETKGFTGSECRAASAFIEKALGKRTSERLTAEFHQTQTEHNVQREGQA